MLMTCKGWVMCEGIEEHYQRIVLKDLGGGGVLEDKLKCGHGNRDV